MRGRLVAVGVGREMFSTTCQDEAISAVLYYSIILYYSGNSCPVCSTKARPQRTPSSTSQAASPPAHLQPQNWGPFCSVPGLESPCSGLFPQASFAPAVPFGAGGRSPKSFLTSWPHAGPSAMGGNLPFLGLNNSSDSRRQRQRQLLLKRAEFTGHSDCSRQGPAPRALISRKGSYARPRPLWTQASPFSRLQPCRFFGR